MSEVEALVAEQPLKLRLPKKRRYVYRFIGPDEQVHKTVCLKHFCKRHGLNQAAMCRINKGTYSVAQHRGWRSALPADNMSAALELASLMSRLVSS